MAQLDLSNAHITPYSSRISNNIYLGIISSSLADANGSGISRGKNALIYSEVDGFKWHYNGTFTTGGTEFYFSVNNYSTWKVTGVSFASGDTYSFTVKANIILNQ